MPEKNDGLTARSLWQKCWQGGGRQAQRSFWSDIVLFMKNYPGKAAYFSELLKKSGVKGYAGQPLSVPLPLLVKKLVKQSESFTPNDWRAVINAWSNIKDRLKTDTQTALLRHDVLIKKFLTAVLTDRPNSKELLEEIVIESGLLPQYRKNDIILMLCGIVAESLAGQTNEKESGIMSEETVTADVGLAADNEEDAARAAIGADAAGGPAAAILQDCLADLAAVDPLVSDWTELEMFLQEIKRTIEKKSGEKAAILARNRLLEKFSEKWDYLSDVFLNQLGALTVQLPARCSAYDMTDSQLSDCADILERLQIVLPRYKEITEKKAGNITEEKNRITLLLETVTEIEGVVQALAAFIKPADNDRAAVFTRQEQENADRRDCSPLEEETDDEEQMELFIGK